MAITIDLFTSTFDATKKAVRIAQTGLPEQLLGTGQFYEINDAESGTTCFIYNSNGDLKLKALWADITIAGAVTPADKKDKLVSFFAEAPAGGGGGGTAVGLYKSAEIDFYNGGLPQTLPLFTTEAGRGRFVPTRVTLEMTDVTGGAFDNAQFSTIYASLVDGNPFTGSALKTYINNSLAVGFGFDFIPAATLVNIDINPNTLLAIVKGIFRIEGYYEDDYV